MLGFSVKWLGHASFQTKANGRNIFVDPYEGTYKDKADLVLVTHAHHDHCDPSKIEMIRKKDTVFVAPKGCESEITGRIMTLEPGEKTTFQDIEVEAVHAYNYKRFRSPGTPFHPKGSGLGYLITIGGRTIYHAGDTDFIPEMKELKNVYLALLPCGGKFTMDIPEAAEAATAVDPEFVIPMHRLNTDPEELKRQIEHVSDIKVVLLEPGEKHGFE